MPPMRATDRDTAGGRHQPEFSRFWATPQLGGVDLLHARFTDHVYRIHTHDAYVFAVITAGREQFRYRGGRHEPGLGEIAIVHPGEPHDGSAATAGGWAYRVMYLPPGIFARIAGRSESAAVPFFPSTVFRDPAIAKRFLRIHAALEAGFETLATEAALTELLGTLEQRHAAGAAPFPARTLGEPAAIRRVREILDEGFAENLSLEHLAAGVGLSPLHLLRLFRRTTGMPPHAYRIGRRVGHAQLLLRQGLPLAETAVACGFADQSHLTRVFKRLIGTTPGIYRAGVHSPRSP
jgi:AraC-like DNA-binding protein